ncbi:MAG: hypothetical protein V1711_01825 [bacterium]
MSWAARRRFIILLIIGIVVVAFLAIVLITALYKTPSCTDGVQNQSEAGIDCGGPCAYLCTAQVQQPVVLFTKVLKNADGRVDVIALVENKNTNAAAKNVPYNITFYGADQIFIQKVSGTLDFPPNTAIPVFVPGISSGLPAGQAGKQKVTSAFLEITASAQQWFATTDDPRIVPIVLNAIKGGTTSEPRIEAILENPGVTILNNVQVIVIVYNDKKEIIAASKTIVPTIMGQGQAVATFTWNSAFASLPTLIEVLPIILLP